MSYIFEGREPKAVLSYFYDFTTIPRGSGNEAGIADYLVRFAEKNGLAVYRDETNNVLIKKPASPTMKSRPTVVLQGHTDMVCEKNADVDFDFTKDPLRLRLDGDWLSAEGTTLGGDDGVAGAIMLALLADRETDYPALECLFTTSEEVGLDGMRAFDASHLNGRMLINIDSVGEGEATVSCAGGCRTDFVFPGKKTENAPLLKLSVAGLAGGHSGENINDGRENAIKLCVRLLSAVSGLRLASIEGGCKDNAIPRECTAFFSADEGASNAILAEWKTAKEELSTLDATATVTLENGGCGSVFDNDFSRRTLAALRALPSGVIEMNHKIAGMPETSANLGVVKTDDDGIRATVSSRSAVDSKLSTVLGTLEAIASLSRADVSHRSRYPGWKFTDGTSLQKVYLDTYRKLTGKEARLIGIHAGLECGLMAEKCPDMDMISIGPDLRDIHSPDERLSLSSLERTYCLVSEMLKNV